MTSLTSLLPESPALPAALAPGLAAAGAKPQAPGAAGPDFAGLLEAVAVPPQGAGGLTAPLPDAPMPETTLLPRPAAPVPMPSGPRSEALSGAAIAGWPGGKNLPEQGAPLPPALPAASSQVPPPAQAPMLVPAAPAVSAPQPGATTEAEGDAQLALVTVRRADSVPAPVTNKVEDISAVALPVDDAAGPEEQSSEAAPQDGPSGDPAKSEAPVAMPGSPAPAPAPLQLPLPLAVGIQSAQVPVASTPAPHAVGLSGMAPAPRLLAGAVPPAIRTAIAARPAQASPLPDPSAGANMAADTSPASAPTPASIPALTPDAPPALAAEAGPVSAPGSGALPAVADLAAPVPAVASGATAPLAERPAEPRAPAVAAAAPKVESAIAQVGDIREALRAARPAMTLPHAEFGMVSLRLEPAAPDQWRAVLASRDPGFVPAVQAALETRAIAAAAEASSNFAGQNGTGQNGTSDHRYGASPNGGQGTSQPYLGQSGSRDGEAAPDHRRPSTAAALAARGEGEADDPGGRAHGAGGLFA